MKLCRLLAVLPLLALGLQAAPAANDVPLPEHFYPQLDAILRRAVQQSPQMINRALDLEMAENNRIQARSGLLPSVGGSYSYNRASDDRADLVGRQNVTKVYYSFSVNQPLFTWGERTNTMRMGQIQQKITQGSYREAYRMLAQDIRGKYLELIVRKTILERGRLADKYSQDVLKLAEDRHAKGGMSDAEIFPVRLDAERAAISLERIGYDFETAKQSLARLIGADTIDDSSIPDEIPELSHAAPMFDQLLAGFLTQKDPATTEAVNLRQQIAMENLNYQSQKVRLLPKFSFVAGASQDEQSYTANVAQKYRVNSIYGGISMYWSIFDGFASGAATRNSLAHRRQLENDYHGLTERLAIQAKAEVKQLDFAARSMSILNRVEVASAGGYHAQQDAYARGVVSENDVTQAHLNYYNNFIEAQNARIDYLLKVGEFLGTLAEDPVIANVADKK